MNDEKKIRSVEHLIKLCTNKTIDCYISLTGGLRSSKEISYDKTYQKFMVRNSIDDVEQILNESELYTHSNIGEAINKEAFYLN